MVSEFLLIPFKCFHCNDRACDFSARFTCNIASGPLAANETIASGLTLGALKHGVFSGDFKNNMVSISISTIVQG